MLAPARPARRSPIIPGNTKERTGSAGILRRAGADIRRRFAGLLRDVLALFDGIRIIGVNDATMPRTVYALTPEQLGNLSAELQHALERWIANGRDPAHLFWWGAYDTEAAQMGTAQSVANLSGLSPAYAASRTLQAVLFSEPYRTRLAAAHVRSMDHWTGLGAAMRADLSSIIGRAVVDGKNPREVRAEIAASLEVSKGRALGYAQTDITGTLRDARWAEADFARDEMGLEVALLWTSAFLPTTRPTHAARHGRAYTTAEVRAFYAKDGNRYRCFLPGTVVAGRFSVGIKSRYQGPAVRLVTAGGQELAVTANHPVLTARGMVPAAEVCEGDKLVAYQRQQELLAARVGELHGQLAGAAIEEVFGALVQAGHQRAARVSPIDLHGDARFCEPEVDVVRADRELVFGMDAATCQLLEDLALVNANAARASGSARHFLRMPDLSHASDEVGRRDVGAPLGSREFRHAVALPVASVAHAEPKIVEGALDGASVYACPLADGEQRFSGHMRGVQRRAALGGPLPHPFVPTEPDHVETFHDRAVANADTVGDVLQRLASLAAFDEVVDVVLFEYSGHVFDLQERSGLMLANRIVASNCHCGQTEALLDETGAPIISQAAKRTMAREREVWQRKYGG